MSSAKNENELLKEELRQALKRAETAQREVEQLKQKNTAAEAKAERLDKQLKDQKRLFIEHVRYAVNGYRVTAKLLNKFKDQIPGFPDVEADQVVWLVKRAEADMEDLPDQTATKLMKYLLATGNESSRKGVHKPVSTSSSSEDGLTDEQQKASQELKEEHDNFGAAVNKTARSLNDKRNATTHLITVLGNLVNKIKTNGGDSPLLTAADQIMKAQVPGPLRNSLPQSSNKKKTKGRQIPEAKDQGELLELSAPEEMTCNYCGMLTKMETVAKTRDFTRHLISALEESLVERTYIRPVVLCPNCGHVQLPDDGKFPVPYSPAPGCQYSSDLISQTGMLATTGLPLNRVFNYFGMGDENKQISTAELNRAVTRFATEDGAIALLVKAHEEAVAHEEVVLSDETPIEVLDQRMQRKDKCAKQAYMQVIAATPNASTQFAIFKRMEGRSAKELEKNLEGFHFDVLVSDGYSGYVTVQRKGGFVLQNCLVHWRRSIIDCIDFPKIEERIKTAEGCQYVLKQLEEGSPAYFLCFVMEALCKLFNLEASLKRSKQEAYDDAYLKKVQSARTAKAVPLMDLIDKTMKGLASKLVVLGENGQYQAISTTSPFAGPVVYYMNARDRLREFLTDPRICMDTNGAERAIRAVTLYKHSAFFKQTQDGLDGYCKYMSLRETAVMNGIAHPTKWVQAFSRAFLLHCIEYDLTERAKSAKIDEVTPLRTNIHRFSEKALKSFDFTPWLAWNYAKRLKSDDKISPVR